MFSKKTVNLVANLDKSDAEAFTRLCGFGVSIVGLVHPLVYDVNNRIYIDNGIDFFTLSNLDSIGLIRFDNLAGYVREDFGYKGFVLYHDQKVWLELPLQTKQTRSTLQLGSVLLTLAGRQLASVCRARPVDGFIDYVKEKWKGFGYKTEL
jgi:hypothetical protein